MASLIHQASYFAGGTNKARTAVSKLKDRSPFKSLIKS